MRYITQSVITDLKQKMVFIGGPRQVGKTTLAKQLLTLPEFEGRYFNWDYTEDRHSLLNKRWSVKDKLLIFDELHKHPQWKTWVKGVFDVQGDEHSILVTGSARLDVYRKGGDSLLGRYHYWRLHPFTLNELPEGITPEEGFERLMTVGGFPEPFTENDLRQSRRWRKARFDRVLNEDIRDLESIMNIQGITLLTDLLRRRVGGSVVLSNLAQDIQVSSPTVKAWLEALENMYLIFKVMPYTQSLPRAIQKPPKLYFFDNADVEDDLGARFENLVACHLLKRLHYLEDYEGYRCELRYVRDKEGREVDFVVVIDGKVDELIEVKYSDDDISPSLKYYKDKLKPRLATQVVAKLKHDYEKDGIRVVSALGYFLE